MWLHHNVFHSAGEYMCIAGMLQINIIKLGRSVVHTRDVRNELLIVLYLDIHVGHDKKAIYTYLGVFKFYTKVYKCTC